MVKFLEYVILSTKSIVNSIHPIKRPKREPIRAQAYKKMKDEIISAIYDQLSSWGIWGTLEGNVIYMKTIDVYVDGEYLVFCDGDTNPEINLNNPKFFDEIESILVDIYGFELYKEGFKLDST